MEPPVELTEQELIDLNCTRQGDSDRTLTEEEKREVQRLRQAYSDAGCTQLIELSDLELHEVHQLRRDLEKERIFKIMQDGADIINQLRNYLTSLRQNTDCPPHIIAKVENEILNAFF